MGESDLTVSPAEIEKRITPRTKAIMIMHYGGYPCQMVEIIQIARKYGLDVIEDAAHAPGAFFNECALGTWGEVGCFSFFSNKNLATGEGGMLVTDRDDIAERVRILRSHGMTSLTWDRHHGHAYTYDVVDLGHNYRIDEIRAALGLVQLKKLEANNARRKTITERYRTGLAGITAFGGAIPFMAQEGQPACHIFPLLLPPNVDRRQFMDGLRERGIQTSIHYPPIHRFSYYQQRYPEISLPLTESIAAREVTLPLYPGMADEDVEFVIKSTEEVLEISYNKETKQFAQL
jgi:dTDP-4-amino-4,6-dideoxygalactose transaminase